MAEDMKTSEDMKKLENEIDTILELYDFGEKMFGYEAVNGPRELNENQRRANNVENRSQSLNLVNGSSFWGLAGMYAYSRPGARNLFDLSKLRQCGWTTASVFCLASTASCAF